MTLEQAIDRYTNNAKYERIHGSLQGCLDFRQLAEWLKDYKRLKEAEMPCVSAEEMQECNDIVKKYTPKQQPCDDEYIKVPKKALKYRTAGMVAYNAEWLKKHWQTELKVMGIECDDAISRQAVLDKAVYTETEEGWSGRTVDVKDIEALPPVTPQQKIGRCKDCKWWRDSDGAYRRGVKAESRCPINTVSVANGWGYCYMFEPQESEEV